MRWGRREREWVSVWVRVTVCCTAITLLKWIALIRSIWIHLDYLQHFVPNVRTNTHKHTHRPKYNINFYPGGCFIYYYILYFHIVHFREKFLWWFFTFQKNKTTKNAQAPNCNQDCVVVTAARRTAAVISNYRFKNFTRHWIMKLCRREYDCKRFYTAESNGCAPCIYYLL